MSTTKVCSKCKVERDRSEFYDNKTAKDGLNWQCKQCQQAYYRQHRLRLSIGDRERKLGRVAGVRTKTEVNAKEKVCRLCKQLKPRSEFYRVNRMADKLNARCKECLKTNRTISNNKYRDLGQPTRERQFHRRHPEVARARKIAGRAREVGADGRFTGKQLLDKFNFHGWRCYLCKVPLPTFASAHAEHRKPLDQGGTNWLANIAPACSRCNSMKHTFGESEYRQRRDRKRCPTCGSVVLIKSVTIPLETVTTVQVAKADVAACT